MMSIKLKTTKEMNLDSSFIDYVSQNNGQTPIPQSLQYYFSDFNNNRNIISQNKDLDSINEINSTLEITKKYCNQLIAIKSKMIFGESQHGFNIEFSWEDTITGDSFISNNINFEYYNILFNLASLFFNSGYKKSTSPNIDKNLRKESIRDFKYSLYLFNIIGNEAINYIPQNELPNDLYPL